MEFKEGMYVRTKYGITQYKEYETNKGKLLCMPLTKGTFANIEDVLKASYDIIDLIEVGDYINGMRVLRVGNIIAIILDNEENISWVKSADIKTILTKEQFENNVYRIGEKL